MDLLFYDGDEYWPDASDVIPWDNAASDPLADIQKMYDVIVQMETYVKPVLKQINVGVTYWHEHIEPILHPPPPRHGPRVDKFARRGKGVKKR